jgi:hypothetical protein
MCRFIDLMLCLILVLLMSIIIDNCNLLGAITPTHTFWKFYCLKVDLILWSLCFIQFISCTLSILYFIVNLFQLLLSSFLPFSYYL